MRTLVAALALSVSLAACATGPSPDQVRAPQPAKSVDLERFYAGRWLEIARLPMGMTDGCVAGASTYTLTAPTQVQVRDTCQVGTPDGREKAIGGRGEIMDPGTNAKMRVRYFWGFVVWDYWVLDHADDYSWSIVGEGSGRYLWLLTRKPPTPAELQVLTDRAKAMGYDTSMLRVTKHS